MRLEGFVTNLIGTDCHSTQLSQETGNGALAAADTSGETNNYHSCLSHLILPATPVDIKQTAWVDVSIARKYHSKVDGLAISATAEVRKSIKL
jgi:hypothetical protein